MFTLIPKIKVVNTTIQPQLKLNLALKWLLTPHLTQTHLYMLPKLVKGGVLNKHKQVNLKDGHTFCETVAVIFFSEKFVRQQEQPVFIFSAIPSHLSHKPPHTAGGLRESMWRVTRQHVKGHKRACEGSQQQWRVTREHVKGHKRACEGSRQQWRVTREHVKGHKRACEGS